MRIILLIGLGSFIGGVSRYLLSQFMQIKVSSVFPYGTLLVNITGCLLIGIVFGLYEKSGLSNEWRLILATGLLGGFTTFSAFSYESITLMRDGHLISALTYISCSVVIGLIATYGGFMAVLSLRG